MRRALFCVTAFLLLKASGCYFPEIAETRISFQDNELPVVILKYTNISSGAEEPDELKEAFDELIDDMYGAEYLVEQATDGFAIRKRRLYIENNRLHAELTGDATKLNEMYSFFEGNEERFLVYEDDDSYELVETNGKIIKTDRNTLIVWPAKMKEIYWKQHLIFTEDDEEETDKKRFHQNIAKMVAMFKGYEAK